MRRARRNGSPALGDPGFLALLHERYRAGHLTRAEWLRRVELHGVLWRARPADEEAALREVSALVAEGVLIRVDAEAAVSPCRYPAHRGSDWRNDGGRLICGVCHPNVGPPGRTDASRNAPEPESDAGVLYDSRNNPWVQGDGREP